MNKNGILKLTADFATASPLNRVEAAVALRPALAGMIMYQPPLMGVASAADPYFGELRRPGVIGPHFRLPREWLPTARSVVSLFLPFADAVVVSNREDPRYPSPEWLHARIEGQAFLNALCRHLAEELRSAGHDAVAPSLDEGFWSRSLPAGADADGKAVPGFSSNWSERHVAHVAGLGTFGLSAGLITRKGIAGRFGSVVTSLPLEPDPRPYRTFDEYCNLGIYFTNTPPMGSFGAWLTILEK